MQRKFNVVTEAKTFFWTKKCLDEFQTKLEENEKKSYFPAIRQETFKKYQKEKKKSERVC